MLNQLYKNAYIYNLILCKPDKNRTPIAEIKYTSLSVNYRFRDIDTLKFTVNYLEPVLHGVVVDPTFDNIKGNYLVLINIINYNTEETISSKYFVIENPTLNGVDRDTKELYCYSLEYQFNKRKLRGYNEVTLLYDNIGSDGLLNYMIGQLKGGWSLGTVPSLLLNQTRIFNYSSNSYTEVFRDLEKIFSCVFTFDTVHNIINITMLDDVGTNYGLFISEENLMKSLTKEEKYEQLVTKLYVYGANNIGIYAKNITSQGYLLDVSFFRNSDYMSPDLLNALDAYDLVLQSKQGEFEGYLTSLNAYNTLILTKQEELKILQTALLVIQQKENAEIIKEGSTGQSYSYWYTQEQAQNGLISDKQTDITFIQNTINTINDQILVLNNSVSLETNFNNEQLKELNNFIFEDSITISEIDDESLLYQEGLYQLGKKSSPPIDFKINIADLFSIPQMDIYWDKMNMGDFVNIDYSKYNINCQEVRLVSYTHEPLSNSLTLEFSTTDKYDSDNFYTVQIWQKANQTVNTVTVERPNYNQYINDKDNILTNGSTINSSDNQIVLPDGSVIGSNGLVMHDSSSNNSQMKILGDRILCTKDNWLHVGVAISGDGINADYIKVGTLQGITLIGNTIKTSSTGGRIEINDMGFMQYDTNNKKRIEILALGTYGSMFLYDSNQGISGTLFETAGTGIKLQASSGKFLFLGDSSHITKPDGAWNCNDASFTYLKDGNSYYATQNWVQSQGYIKNTSGYSGNFSTGTNTVYVTNGLITGIT